MSTSSRMIAASLPPSSRSMRLMFFEHAAMTMLPTVVDPVKTTLFTSGWLVIISPGFGVVVSCPTTTFRTPGGRIGPRSSPILRDVRGVSGAGFSTTVFPQARALAVGFQPRTMGAFHGAMTATTPMGERFTTMRLGARSSMTSSSLMSSTFAAFSKFAAATKISSFVSAMGRPLSLVCSVARDSMSSRRIRAHSVSSARRFSLGRAAQEGPARWAPTMAASMSSRLAMGAAPTLFPVAGFLTSNVLSVRMIWPSTRRGARSRMRG
mmetsp:Transcript_63462/g.186172  ORF Transcript_63462/g.186172 Transcript_63462/m.186172 type:complete len:266 (+) Transcript_63462:1630-2427(+)